jgi:hypothetical protein
MIHHILDGMNPTLPEGLNRPEVYYYGRHLPEQHIPVPPGYDIESVLAANSQRSRGWKSANAREE